MLPNATGPYGIRQPVELLFKVNQIKGLVYSA